jgi:phosphoribosylformimino-5-aminoimidazole carboxamide ribonucleotide (ProFAR) isomerase
LRSSFSDGVAGVIVGRALYEERFTLAEAIKAAA